MSDSVWSQRRQPTRLPHLWGFPGWNTGVGCHFLLQCMKVKLLSHVRLFPTAWTAAYQAPPSMGFSRQEYWSGVPFPSPASVWDEHNCVLIWAFFGIAFLWDWNENWPFPVLWPMLFSKFAGILSGALSQHHLLGFEIAQLEFHHLH